MHICMPAFACMHTGTLTEYVHVLEMCTCTYIYTQMGMQQHRYTHHITQVISEVCTDVCLCVYIHIHTSVCMSSGNLGFYITHGVNVQIYVQEQLDGCTAYELQAERERERQNACHV